eukprot:12934367-Prorocentrum_lima.AAC.1
MEPPPVIKQVVHQPQIGEGLEETAADNRSGSSKNEEPRLPLRSPWEWGWGAAWEAPPGCE